jgi:indolepyruvate ferredoxin oxidoreductase alpha subunit
MHAREAGARSELLKLGMTYPLPLEKIRAFAAGVTRCIVIEEGDPYLSSNFAPPASRSRASRSRSALAS